MLDSRKIRKESNSSSSLGFFCSMMLKVIRGLKKTEKRIRRKGDGRKETEKRIRRKGDGRKEMEE